MPKQTPKEALQHWATSNQVSPADFGRKMGYSYNYAYQLLRGESEVKIDMLGRFVVAYGMEAAKPLAASFSDSVDMDGALITPTPPRAVRPYRKTSRSKIDPTTIKGVKRGLRSLEAA
jgi:hypothetical protein